MPTPTDLEAGPIHPDELVPLPGDLGATPLPEAGFEADDPGSQRAAAGPAPTADVRRAYLGQAVIGYAIYAVGAVSAFLAVALSLSDTQAGLHSSALAAGIAVAGLSGDRLDARLGPRAVHLAGLALLGAGGIMLVWAPAFAVTLAAAAAIGLGSGLLLGHINQTLSAGGGALARVRLARSTLIAMFASLSVPLVIGAGIAIELGWQLVVVPALALVVLAVVASRGRLARSVGTETARVRLPRAYWLAWALVALVVAVEFAMVFWGSSLVERQTGIPLGDATLVLAAFFVGMIAGRSALSAHAVSRHDPIWLMRAGISLALLGSLLPLVPASVPLSVVGLFLGGSGVGLLFPLGASISLAAVPGHARQAASRLVIASGLAILAAPFVLGVVADAAGVIVGWLLIPAICLAALGLSVPVARATDQGRPKTA
ncbi:hypothetical protein BH23CHL8_BH23CHL8_01620 [soil metagenome]